MDQAAEVVWGLMVIVGILMAFGALAMAFGADSRHGLGDDHTTRRASDWW